MVGASDIIYFLLEIQASVTIYTSLPLLVKGKTTPPLVMDELVYIVVVPFSIETVYRHLDRVLLALACAVL